MATMRAALLFAVAAFLEIGGAWLIWQAVRQGRAWWLAGLGVMALGAYGFVATLQADADFGPVLAAYGGVFVVGSLAWGAAVDGYRPGRGVLLGALVCLVGVSMIMYTSRSR